MTTLQTTIEQSTQKLLAAEGVRDLLSPRTTAAQFTAFSIQRHALTTHFVPLLKRIIELCEKRGVAAVHAEVKKNLHDELGQSITHASQEHGSHAKWRANYLSAIGIDTGLIESAMLTPGTTAYNTYLVTRLEDSSLSHLLGMLLFLEWSIPLEFRVIRECRDTTLPEKFVIQHTDSPDVKKEKGKARLYIDHHIIHDEKDHFPKLLKAIDSEHTKLVATDIIRGVEAMMGARIAFYTSVHDHIFTS